MSRVKGKTRVKENEAFGRSKVSFHLLKKSATKKPAKTEDKKSDKSAKPVSGKRKSQYPNKSKPSGSQTSLSNTLGSKTSLDQLKEFGERVGVSWSRKWEATSTEGQPRHRIERKNRVGQESYFKRKTRSGGSPRNKIGFLEAGLVSRLWGSDDGEFASVRALGASRGLVIIWDKNKFSCNSIIQEEDFLVVIGKWHGVDDQVGFINVYGPNLISLRKDTWDRLKVY
ncbi:hypothetical protein OSB04_031282 [Centaurea solstitialis]|uniref:Uncharacterized protein n=1 Tax=Centaurea solstitialis TaxID=347529 RepID=A0AA38W5U5_9ASTR|nr:hypothetical protein OSB04_031282 [Centaurea solstitialis]